MEDEGQVEDRAVSRRFWAIFLAVLVLGLVISAPALLHAATRVFEKTSSPPVATEGGFDSPGSGDWGWWLPDDYSDYDR